MRYYRLLFAWVVCFSLLAAPVLAGPNYPGVLIVHATPLFLYDSQGIDHCPFSQLEDCGSANTNVPTYEAYVWWIAAGFPYVSSPRVTGITFGVDYDPAVLFLHEWGYCSDFELPAAGWPGPNTGNATTWGYAQTEDAFDIYWFAGYSYYVDETEFRVTAHPDQGGNFGDDSIPMVLDPIVDYGRLGFGSNQGYNPCPGPPTYGACCYDDGTCEVTTVDSCYGLGGAIWLGSDWTCDPDPCAPPGIGACCLVDGTCFLAPPESCDQVNGEYQGLFEDCYPNPCDPVPSEVPPEGEISVTSWGRIKNQYR